MAPSANRSPTRFAKQDDLELPVLRPSSPTGGGWTSSRDTTSIGTLNRNNPDFPFLLQQQGFARPAHDPDRTHARHEAGEVHLDRHFGWRREMNRASNSSSYRFMPAPGS